MYTCFIKFQNNEINFGFKNGERDCFNFVEDENEVI